MERATQNNALFDDALVKLDETLKAWRAMSRSDLDDAADDADRFQMLFYEWIDCVRAWVESMDGPPGDADASRAHPQFARLWDALPDALQVPFEAELDGMLAGISRDVDSTEQG